MLSLLLDNKGKATMMQRIVILVLAVVFIVPGQVQARECTPKELLDAIDVLSTGGWLEDYLDVAYQVDWGAMSDAAVRGDIIRSADDVQVRYWTEIAPLMSECDAAITLRILVGRLADENLILALLSSHYRADVPDNWDLLTAHFNAVDNIREIFSEISKLLPQ